MSFIKKYYPMITSILFIGIYCLLIADAALENSFLVGNNFPTIWFIFILALLLFIAIWAEIIGFMIHAAKNNNVIWALWIYIFNIFVMPYYNLKYVVKEENVTKQTLFFSILLILSPIIFLFIWIFI